MALCQANVVQYFYKGLRKGVINNLGEVVRKFADNISLGVRQIRIQVGLNRLENWAKKLKLVSTGKM